MARSVVAVGTAVAAGTALYVIMRSRRNLAGSWYSVAKTTGEPNGDQYEFRFEGGVYKIYRGGQNGDKDQFTVVGDKVQHEHGPSAIILPSGELHWDIDKGKWLSRKKGIAPIALRMFSRLFMSLHVPADVWPPAHAPADDMHFGKLKSEGGVHQVWLISKHDGSKYVQHNLADGTYKAYGHDDDDEVDAGTWALKDGAYTEVSKHDFQSLGKLVGHARRFHMDVDCGPHGYHKYTPTYEAYAKGMAQSSLPEPWPYDEAALPLVLVKKGSSEAAVFEQAEALSKGEAFVPLTLKGSGAQAAIVLKAPTYKKVHGGHFRLCTPGIGKAEVALRARLDAEGGHLTLESHGFILDVDHWKYVANNKLWFLQEGEDVTARRTRNPDGGRSFVVNADDGTISPRKAPELVLGFATVAQLCLVKKGSTKACVFEHAAALRKAGAAHPLTLSSHPGLAVVTQYETPRNFHDYCEYIELGVAPVNKAKPALVVTYDDETWLCRDTVVVTKQVVYKGKPLVEAETKEYTMALDVAFGKMEDNNSVNMLQRLGPEPTKEEGNKARAFAINDDGTVSPKAAPDLVLGMAFVPAAKAA